jgi:RNase P subunit RPR2
VSCDKCHFPVDAAGTRVAAGTPDAVVRYRPIGFASCADCHADPHQKRFGLDCARCHTAEGWKNLGLAGFDHSKTRFALTGKHLQVECARCHYPENAAGQRVAAGTEGARVHYKPLNFAACTDCHNDPHQKRFGLDCTRCHSTAGWPSITAGAFDHDKTRYPLRGRHVQVACEKCHRDQKTSQPLDFAACTDCHADAHGGQLASRADRGACETCHTVDGYTPARFGAEEHARTRFPLAGAHRAITCLVCHRPPSGVAGGAPDTQAMAVNALPGGKAIAVANRPALATASSDFRFHFANLACAGCHDDRHAGQFAVAAPKPAPVVAAAQPASSAAGTDCARCHLTATWRIADFDHAKTRFPLEGAHRRTACASCHRPLASGDNTVVRYKPLDTACRSCHAEPKPLLGK